MCVQLTLEGSVPTKVVFVTLISLMGSIIETYNEMVCMS
jgi:hypothetical protein